jgi:hypothetical protein
LCPNGWQDAGMGGISHHCQIAIPWLLSETAVRHHNENTVGPGKGCTMRILNPLRILAISMTFIVVAVGSVGCGDDEDKNLVVVG